MLTEQPENLRGHAMTAVGNLIIIFGGCKGEYNCGNDLLFFDIEFENPFK